MSDFHLDLGPLKEPLGFIKLLEWLFAVFAFASCGGYKGVTTLLVSCHGVVNKTITASFSYPFRIMRDYIFTLCAAFLWLVSTAAWAKALVDIKISTGYRIVEEIPVCKMVDSSCTFASVTSMGSLNVSVVFGLVNMILWGGNAWFVYKETSLHKSNSNSPKPGFYPPTSGI
ncbi:PREDICTED: synaptophysin-like protein 1 [Thamnophis sirtalis]|uniref:Synaptophysin-like protein 1 n=1 Tax=Thamnophis sirtalis TaxID=35019 RepID=A0A6I9YCQ4_9SAUR|nr:PREDICTED: synaptophysin-like protein 1 [Thamnophis sirtalis]